MSKRRTKLDVVVERRFAGDVTVHGSFDVESRVPGLDPVPFPILITGFTLTLLHSKYSALTSLIA